MQRETGNLEFIVFPFPIRIYTFSQNYGDISYWVHGSSYSVNKKYMFIIYPNRYFFTILYVLASNSYGIKPKHQLKNKYILYQKSELILKLQWRWNLKFALFCATFSYMRKFLNPEKFNIVVSIHWPEDRLTWCYENMVDLYILFYFQFKWIV